MAAATSNRAYQARLKNIAKAQKAWKNMSHAERVRRRSGAGDNS